ncbi:MAG: radical SAM protein [bacterium]|nr:radical SAM protein [bacterium]
MLKVARISRNILLKRHLLCLWQITARCNYTCRICNFWKEKHLQEDELTVEEIERVVENLKPLAPLIVSLAGGEPLLRDDVPEIVKAVSRYNYCSLITNGWHATPELAARLYKNGLTDVMVSLDYTTPEKHDAQRGQAGAFERAVAALEYFRDRRPNKSNNVRILTVLMDDNIDEIEGLLLLAKELSVSFAITLYSDRLGKKAHRLPGGPVSDYLIELKRRHSCFNNAEYYLKNFDELILHDGIANCGGGNTFININQNGMISRCIDRSDAPIANPLSDSPDDIKSFLRAESNNEPCSQCWTSCRGLADVITGVKGIKSYPDFIRSVR